jgi:5-methyltetrahydropteroyltriglutamate--homocysteine methyltransferase
MSAAPPFRADQVGSLLRPPALHEARGRARAGTIAATQLSEIQDRAIREAVTQQEAIGLEAITDGELRRDFWHLDFLSGLEGVELRASTAMKFHGAEDVPPTAAVSGRLRCTRPIMVEHFSHLRSLTTRTPKFTIPSPSMLHLRGGRQAISRAVYPELDAFWVDAAAAYRDAIGHLATAGCRYLQLDDVSFAYLCDETVRENCRSNGDDPAQLPRIYAEVINGALRDRPPGMTVTMHTCRGNFRSSWVAAGAYDAQVLDAMFSTNVDAFFMEFDSARAGGFEPLARLPRDKKIVLGLVTTKTGALESRDTLIRRIEEASRFVPLDRLCLSPQCGFASTHHGNTLSVDDQWRKLELVVDVAREVWG